MQGLRKVVTVVEEVHREGGRAVDPPVRRAHATSAASSRSRPE